MDYDSDLVLCGDYTRAWLEPTTELRFIVQDGHRILQQKWKASATEMRNGRDVLFEQWRWKDVPLDDNPERDSC